MEGLKINILLQIIIYFSCVNESESFLYHSNVSDPNIVIQIPSFYFMCFTGSKFYTWKKLTHFVIIIIYECLRFDSGPTCLAAIFALPKSQWIFAAAKWFAGTAKRLFEATNQISGTSKSQFGAATATSVRETSISFQLVL